MSFEKLCREADKKKKAERAAETAKVEPPPPPSIEELEAATDDLINCPDILNEFGDSVESIGLVGETKRCKDLISQPDNALI